MSAALILTGAPGSGKSSVLDALSTLLEIEQVPFGAIETEQLARGYPWLSEEEWIPQLAARVALQRNAGRETFLVERLARSARSSSIVETEASSLGGLSPPIPDIVPVVNVSFSTLSPSADAANFSAKW